MLLISSWPAAPGTGAIGRIVINGRSWPHTERLTYKVGETVRMRVINAGPAVHPMHLHGFYFNVDSRGDERADTVFPRGSSARMVVTERLTGGRTFSLTWKPTRPGNWLFHCHDNVHLQRGIPLDGGTAPAPHAHVENHALEMMAGPVMGITVTGKSIEPRSSATIRRRQLRLVARVDQGGTAEEPAYGYTLHAGATTGAPPPPYLPGPTIVLKRGEPVSIVVKNELPEPTSVHWHGIELESYSPAVVALTMASLGALLIGKVMTRAVSAQPESRPLVVRVAVFSSDQGRLDVTEASSRGISFRRSALFAGMWAPFSVATGTPIS